jgi:hypothetical protein
MSSNSNIRNNPGSSKQNNGVFNYVMIGLAVFLIIFFIYSTIKGYRDFQKYSPYLIDGIVDGTVAQKVPSNMIKPTSDNQWGTEFSYSFWIFIKDTNFSSNTTGQCSNGSSTSSGLPLLHVFHKGSYDYVPSSNNNQPSYPLLQMPGVWLYPNTNKLHIQFNTYDNVVETSDVGNIPLNMWVNIVVVLIGNSVDIYVNGNLKKRTKLKGVPKINYGDMYISNWGGFIGYLSKLQYFNKAIQPYVIDQIFSGGPSRVFASDTTQSINDPTANLSQNYWMTTGYPNSKDYPGYNQSSQTTT